MPLSISLASCCVKSVVVAVKEAESKQSLGGKKYQEMICDEKYKLFVSCLKVEQNFYRNLTSKIPK